MEKKKNLFSTRILQKELRKSFDTSLYVFSLQACMEFQFYKEITALPTTTPALPTLPASSAPLSVGGATDTLSSVATSALPGQQQSQQIPQQQHASHGHHVVIFLSDS